MYGNVFEKIQPFQVVQIKAKKWWMLCAKSCVVYNFPYTLAHDNGVHKVNALK